MFSQTTLSIQSDPFPQARPNQVRNQIGMTLLEVMIAVTVMGILMSGLVQILGTVLHSAENAADHSQVSGTAQFAVERMVRFVTSTDDILFPADDAAEHEQLKISERTLDGVMNATRAAGQDGIPDADTDADTLINEGDTDIKEYVSFALDKSDAGNWKLTEQVPDYTTAVTSDVTTAQVICEQVTAFKTELLSPGVIRIRLQTGAGTHVTEIETRATARLLTY